MTFEIDMDTADLNMISFYLKSYAAEHVERGKNTSDALSEYYFYRAKQLYSLAHNIEEATEK